MKISEDGEAPGGGGKASSTFTLPPCPCIHSFHTVVAYALHFLLQS
jgi:hypothetical protein